MEKNQSAWEVSKEKGPRTSQKEPGRWVSKMEFIMQKRKKWDSRRGNSVKLREIIPSPKKESGNKL